jgi:hypothetical protein
MKDLEDILSGRETAPEVETKEVETQATETPQEAPEAPSDEPSDGQTTVPVAALQAERQKAKSYKEQVAAFEQRLAEQNSVWENRLNQLFANFNPQQQMQEPPKAPDFWEAPETAIDYRLNQTVAPLAGKLQQMREDFSRMQAIDKHGQQTVDAAFSELVSLRNAGDPSFSADYQRIMASPHPFGTLVEWHRKRQTLAEIGDDPAAYKAKLEAELKAKLMAELQANPPLSPNAPPAVMPSNFATSRNVGSRSGPAWSGPQAIGDIFKR